MIEDGKDRPTNLPGQQAPHGQDGLDCLAVRLVVVSHHIAATRRGDDRAAPSTLKSVGDMPGFGVLHREVHVEAAHTRLRWPNAKLSSGGLLTPSRSKPGRPPPSAA